MSNPPDPHANFAKLVLGWFKDHGRKDLPWQQNPTPYRVWVSEIMLQQTQVSTVIDYYARFMDKFPDVNSLANATEDQVLHLWTGLGYYARARNLHKAAIAVVNEFEGKFPESAEALESLPGIGRSTAGAIASLAMNIRAPILDGNVKRVLTRYHRIEGWPEQSAVKSRLWEIAENHTPREQVASYTQAMMDLGATLCTRSKPDCESCPLNKNCVSYIEGRQTEIPGKKPKKKLPVKTVQMFILKNSDGSVLLEKRPPSGIWGGLHSLPESETEKADYLISGLEFQNSNCKRLPAIRHTFSHYHLDITPVQVNKWQLDAAVADSDQWLWYPLDNSVEVGLAAPVKKLLSRLS